MREQNFFSNVKDLLRQVGDYVSGMLKEICTFAKYSLGHKIGMTQLNKAATQTVLRKLLNWLSASALFEMR